MSPLQVGLHTGLHAVPELLLDDGRLLPRERLVFVRDLAQVDPVLQHLVEGSAREHSSARSSSISADSLLAPNSLLLQMRAQLRHTALFQIGAKDLLHPFGFFGLDRQLPVPKLVAEGNDSPHPHALALRGSNLVTDALARHFPLELREGKQNVESQPSHGSGGVELLSDGDEADALLVEMLYDLGEVGERSCEPINLVDHHRIDSL